MLHRPSFNGALASIEASIQHEANPDNILLPQQYYCVVNTLFSLLGSVLSTFAVSSWLNNGRFDMMHVQVRHSRQLRHTIGVLLCGFCSYALPSGWRLV
jgi:hypothetical protein